MFALRYICYCRHFGNDCSNSILTTKLANLHARYSGHFKKLRNECSRGPIRLTSGYVYDFLRGKHFIKLNIRLK